jgi:hypothetical protein
LIYPRSFFFRRPHAITEQRTFRGLPAVGFAAINYINGNVTPGMLANYSGTYPHRSTVACTASPPAVCP